MRLIGQKMNRQEQAQHFADWMQEHPGIPEKVARSFCASLADREDLLQEIRVAIWLAIPAYGRRSKVSSYIYRISLNRAISWRRRAPNRHRPESLDEHGPVAESSTDTDPRLEIVYDAIRHLPQAERALILLQLDGFSYREIAETLGLTESNVGVRLNRIRQKLTEQLKGKEP